MEELLINAKQQLLKPTKEAKRKLLIIMNMVFIFSTVFFLSSEKIAQGKFTPVVGLLIYVYLPAVIMNIASLIYNIWSMRKKTTNIKIDKITAYASMMSIMFMSFCNMMGYGNPSNDAIITDYALGHTLILISVVVVGRRLSVVWFFIVLAVLVYNTNKMGWDFQYHYLTPTEVVNYERGLENQESWALERKRQLMDTSLESPNVTRYFNTWLIFILVSFLTAKFFSGITLDVIEIVPKVIKDIEKSIKESVSIKQELVQKNTDLTEYALRMINVNETFERIDLELEKLDYHKRDEFKPIIEAIRKRIEDDSDWDNFKNAFNAVHTDFFRKIEQKFKHLSDAELKHLVYIKLGFSSAEIAKMLRVKNSSLRSLRYRLKKKLELGEDMEIKDFLESL